MNKKSRHVQMNNVINNRYIIICKTLINWFFNKRLQLIHKQFSYTYYTIQPLLHICIRKTVILRNFQQQNAGTVNYPNFLNLL